MLDKRTKDRVIKKFAVHTGDTGSSQVQIALLSQEIKELTEHLKEHKHDFSSRRGLIRKVSQRRKLLRYFEGEDSKAYEDLTKTLKIRRRMGDAPKAELEEEGPLIKVEETEKQEAAQAEGEE